MKTRILTTILALFAIATAAQAQFGGGSGQSKNDPYIISTTDHLTELADNVNGGNRYQNTYFRLDADLDFTGKTYTIIGDILVDQNARFYGRFNGNGHTISGVTINRTTPGQDNSDQIGLFGLIGYGATIENLTLSNSTIKGRYAVGGIVGFFQNFYSPNPDTRCIVQNCHVTSDVTIETVDLYFANSWQPSGCVGGIVGVLSGDPGGQFLIAPARRQSLPQAVPTKWAA